MLALVCISPEGDYRVEFDNFDYENVQEARDHSASMGLGYYFFPVRVIADSDTRVIEEAPELFEFLVGAYYDDVIISDVGERFREVCKFVYDYDRPNFVRSLQKQVRELTGQK